MHVIQLYIDESLDAAQLGELRQSLMDVPNVVDVELSSRDHHDVLVEYQANTGMPMSILRSLRRHGLHPDVVSA